MHRFISPDSRHDVLCVFRSPADGEEGSGRAGGEGQRCEDEDEPVHPSAAGEGRGQETGSAAHVPGA